MGWGAQNVRPRGTAYEQQVLRTKGCPRRGTASDRARPAGWTEILLGMDEKKSKKIHVDTNGYEGKEVSISQRWNVHGKSYELTNKDQGGGSYLEPSK